MSDTDWDETPTGVSNMADESPGPAPEDETTSDIAAPTEAVNPQVRLTEPGADTFVIPDLGGLTIGRQWHEVSADQLERIQDAARISRVAIEVKEDSQDAE